MNFLNKLSIKLAVCACFSFSASVFAANETSQASNNSPDTVVTTSNANSQLSTSENQAAANSYFDRMTTKLAGSWWEPVRKNTLNILEQDSLSILVPFYSRHGRSTYTPERIAELNEKTWGLGFSKTRRTEKDNEEMLFGLIISDSHFAPQLMAGYTHQWMQNLGSSYEVGVGFTAMIVSRTDYFSGIPFPAALPVASIGTKKNKLMLSYVPHLSKKGGNGDVLFLFAKFELN